MAHHVKIKIKLLLKTGSKENGKQGTPNYKASVFWHLTTTAKETAHARLKIFETKKAEQFNEMALQTYSAFLFDCMWERLDQIVK